MRELLPLVVYAFGLYFSYQYLMERPWWLDWVGAFAVVI
jgi:hypothetical protein